MAMTKLALIDDLAVANPPALTGWPTDYSGDAVMLCSSASRRAGHALPLAAASVDVLTKKPSVSSLALLQRHVAGRAALTSLLPRALA